MLNDVFMLFMFLLIKTKKKKQKKNIFAVYFHLQVLFYEKTRFDI